AARRFGFLLGIGGLVATGRRRRAEEARQVVEVQAPRQQARGEQRALAGGVDLHVAGQVAVADRALEAVVAPEVAVAAQAPVQRVRRGWRQGQAEQWI